MAKSRKPPQPPKQRRMRGTSRFKRSEAKRLLQSARDVGLNVSGLEVDPNTGALRVLFGEPEASKQQSRNRWDEVLNHAAHKKRPP
jgi:hypothetical protein